MFRIFTSKGASANIGGVETRLLARGEAGKMRWSCHHAEWIGPLLWYGLKTWRKKIVLNCRQKILILSIYYIYIYIYFTTWIYAYWYGFKRTLLEMELHKKWNHLVCVEFFFISFIWVLFDYVMSDELLPISASYLPGKWNI